MFGGKKKKFVSDVDEFLQTLWKEIPPSPAQEKERDTYDRIDYLRDHKGAKEGEASLWEGF